MGSLLSQESTESELNWNNLAIEINNKLLVYGFIRDVCKELAMEHIHIFSRVPLSIFELCFKYATINQRYFLFTKCGFNDTAEICIRNFYKFQENSSISNKYTLKPNEFSVTFDKLSLMTIAQTTHLPNWISLKAKKNSDPKTLLFIIDGQYPTSCELLYFDQISEKCKDMNIDYNTVSLPDMMMDHQSVSAICETNGMLYAFDAKYMSELNYFANDEEIAWNIFNISDQTSSINSNLVGTSMCAINDEQLIIVGGYFDLIFHNVNPVYSIKCRLYDCRTHNIIHQSFMNCERYQPGIYYDRIYGKCYVGGGYNPKYSSFRSVEYFDCQKLEWFDIKPRTLTDHRFNPLLFTDMCNPNILFIAGDAIKVRFDGRRKTGFIEYLDLRENNNQWRLISKSHKYSSSVLQLKDFHDEIDVSNINECYVSLLSFEQ